MHNNNSGCDSLNNERCERRQHLDDNMQVRCIENNYWQTYPALFLQYRSWH